MERSADLLDNVWIKSSENAVKITVSMNVEVDRLGKIQAEDAHDYIDHISSGY